MLFLFGPLSTAIATRVKLIWFHVLETITSINVESHDRVTALIALKVFACITAFVGLQP